jgi:predicted phosphodiesterase
MRYAILSDIHSNLQAWNAVLLDIRSLGVDKIICLGDTVGYGPNPAQVLESVYTNVDYFVLGNHDAVLCGKLDGSMFTDSARSVLEWTRGQVGRNALKFLSNLPLTLDGTTFRCAHGEFAEPGYFDYVIEPQDAMASWQAVQEPLLFVGHTHVPAIFLLGNSGAPHVVAAQDFALEPGKRYLVNVGSVGQPRDGDARASYCIYDQTAGTVCWRRIPFDIDAYRRAVADAGISVSASGFLNFDPRKGVPPIREMLSFSPARTPEKAARNVAAVHTLEVLQKRIRRWKLLFGFALVALLAILLVAIFTWVNRAGQQITIAEASALPVIDAGTLPSGTNMLRLGCEAITAGQIIPEWTITLLNKQGQSVSVEAGGAAMLPVLVLNSDGSEIKCSSRIFTVEPGMKFQIEAVFKPEQGFIGDIWIGVELTRKTTNGERVNHYNPKAPSSTRKDGWSSAKSTFTLPTGSTCMRFEIYGKFKGGTRVKDVQLRRKTPSASDDGSSH